MRFLPISHYIDRLEYSPDGERLATLATVLTGSVSPGVQIWDAENGRSIGPTALARREINDISWGGDSRQLMIATQSGSIEVWDVVEGKKTRVLEESPGAFDCVAGSPDGKWVAGGKKDGPVSVWNAKTGKRIQRFQQSATCLVFSTDGRFLAMGAKGKIQIWNIEKEKTHREFAGKWGRPYDIVFSPDNKFLGISGDVRLIRLDSKTGDIRTLGGMKPETAYTVAFSRDGSQLLTAGFNRPALWDVETGKEMRRFEGTGGFTAGFSPDGKTLALSRRRLMLVDLKTGKERKSFAEHTAAVVSLEFSTDGKSLFSGGIDRTIYRWTNSKWDKANKFTIEEPSSLKSSLSHDGKFFAVAQNKSIVIKSTDNGRVMCTLKGPDETVLAVRFSPVDDVLSSVSENGTLILWDYANRRRLAEDRLNIKEDRHGFVSIDFSPDGKEIALRFPMKKKLIFWDVKARRVIRSMHAFGGFILPFAYSPDNKMFAMITGTGKDGRIGFYDRKTGKHIRDTEGGIQFPWDIAWSPDGNFVAIGNRRVLEKDDSVRHEILVYSAKTGKSLVRFAGQNGAIRSVAFSPDSSKLLSGCEDSTILVWDLTPFRKNLSVEMK